jgi:hypothetical protein
MVGSMSVIVAMAVSSTCVPRDERRIPHLQVGALRLEYVSERIAAMKMCDDLRSGLPILLLLFYIGVLCLFLETQLQWQKELDMHPNKTMDGIKTWSGLLLLSVSAVGLFMVIVYDHTGVHRMNHGIGVLLMLLGLAGVYTFTVVYESICNLRMHAQHHEITSEMVLGIAHALAVVLFALAITLFIIAWVVDQQPLAVLSEYIIFLLILVMAIISMVELPVLQQDSLQKASLEKAARQQTSLQQETPWKV